MSYNYDEIVSSIQKHRTKAYKNYVSTKDKSKIETDALNEAVEAFSTLSSNCPLPPTLWIQYGKDASTLLEILNNDDDSMKASSLETQSSIYEMGLMSYPASLLLRRFYLQCMKECYELKVIEFNKFKLCCQDALEWISYGSYYSYRYNHEIQNIWNVILSSLDEKQESLQQLWCKRASFLTENFNESFMNDVQNSSLMLTPGLLQQMEESRKMASKYKSILSVQEDSVMECLVVDGVIQDYTDEDILYSNTISIGMGLGGIELAQSFCNYAKTVQHQISHPSLNQILPLQLFERGISECPTVELIWCQYLDYILKDDNNTSAESNESNDICLAIVSRAVKNCPYSTNLFIRYLQYTLNDHIEDDDDDEMNDDFQSDLVDIVQKARDASFIQNYTQLYIEMCRIPERILLSNKKFSSNLQVLTHYVQSIRNLYDQANDFIQKDDLSKAMKQQELGQLCYHRALFEAYTASPMLKIQNNHSHVVNAFNSCVKLSPSNILFWSDYIQYMKSYCTMKFDYQSIRNLYQRSLTNISKEQVVSSVELSNLCQQYLTFEYHYSSGMKELEKAKNFVQKKLQFQDYQNKRKNSDNDDQGLPTNKKIKLSHPVAEDDIMQDPQSVKRTNLKQEKEQKEYIIINHLKYPIHPYTIHISNIPLAIQNEHDLLQYFEQFGTILYVRFLNQRQRKNKSSSKSGLMQFQDRSSVKEIFDYLKEKSILVGDDCVALKIATSHIPALDIQAPKQRQNYHTHIGSKTKKDSTVQEAKKGGPNKQQHHQQKKKFRLVVDDVDMMERMSIDDDGDNGDNDKGDTKSSKKDEQKLSKKVSLSSSVLAFQPRNVKKK